MKKLVLILLCVPMIGMGQGGSYSNPMIHKKPNNTLNVNQNVRSRSTINKTVRTIDYGQLRAAEALKEKNRLETAIYTDEKERLIALEIAAEPLKAYDYGRQNKWDCLTPCVPHWACSSPCEKFGFIAFTLAHRRPSDVLFADIGNYTYQNISRDNITTEIDLEAPQDPLGQMEPSKYKLKVSELGAEVYCKNTDNWKVGTLDKDGNYLHKQVVNKVKVFRHSGFLRTRMYEDDYEYVISDKFIAVYDGIVFDARIKYSGDKDEITFEDLEGRRYYFRRLCNQIISTAYLEDYTKLPAQGEGTYNYEDGSKYVGEWEDGDRQGQGTYTYNDGSKYEGEWESDEKHGQGTRIYEDGSKYVGEWKEGNRHGKGTYTGEDGTIQKGEWKKDLFKK